MLGGTRYRTPKMSDGIKRRMSRPATAITSVSAQGLAAVARCFPCGSVLKEGPRLRGQAQAASNEDPFKLYLGLYLPTVW